MTESIKTKSECNHVFAGDNETRCGLNKGHDGAHALYGKNKDGSIFMKEWNDKGETAPEEMGQGFQVDYGTGHDERQKVMNIAIHAAKHKLPKGKIFEIRAKILPYAGGGDYGNIERTKREREKDWGIGWYCFKEEVEGFEYRSIKQGPLFCNDVDDHIAIETGGYLLLARIEA